VGVGSVCRRNGKPDEVLDILASIKQIRSDLRLHGFGLKQLALENKEVRSHLYSCDSMAWSVPRRFFNQTPELELAHQYQEKIMNLFPITYTNVYRQQLEPGTAGSKSQWNRPTKAIRIPAEFADELIEIAKAWDNQ
jgi:hypothetical protein